MEFEKNLNEMSKRFEKKTVINIDRWRIRAGDAGSAKESGD